MGFGATIAARFASVLPEDGFEQIPVRVDGPTVDGLECITVNLERVEQQVGPAELIGPLTYHVHSMTARLRQSSMSPAQRVRLSSLAAEAAGMLAMAEYVAMVMLAAAKGLPVLMQAQSRAEWWKGPLGNGSTLMP